MRHARKHLGWALDAAAAAAGASEALRKDARLDVLTATDPTIVLRRLTEAFARFAAVR
jgi:tRNA-dihydrouridine synthase B